MKKKIFWLIWEFGEGWYLAFGFDIFAPVKLVFPGFSRWVFQGMTGFKGVKIDEDDAA